MQIANQLPRHSYPRGLQKQSRTQQIGTNADRQIQDSTAITTRSYGGTKHAIHKEFTDKSSADFLTKLAAQTAAYEEESAIAGNLWTDIDLRLIKKYPLGAAGSGLSNLLKLIIIVLLAFAPALFLDQMFDPLLSAMVYSILVGLGFCIYISFNRATNEKWVMAAERNIGYLLSLLLINMVMHAAQTADSIGVKSFTFATFAILALVVLIIVVRNGYMFPHSGFGKLDW